MSLVYHAKTRGGRYQVKVFMTGKDSFHLREYTRSRETGAASNYTLAQMKDRVERLVSDAAKIDGINYKPIINDLFDKTFTEEERMKKIRKIELRFKDVMLICDEDQAVYGETVTCSNEVSRLVNILIGYEVTEVFLVFMLDTKNRVISYQETSRGGMNACALKPADVFRGAIGAGASAIIAAHNHPSGEPSPSQEDVQFTRRMVRAGELIGIQVLDHIIIGKDGEFFSFLDTGMLRDMTKPLGDNVLLQDQT